MIRRRALLSLLAASVATGLAFASMAAVTASNCKMVQIAELPVRLTHDKLIVDGTINGQKIGVMLDTGVMDTLIVRSAAVRLGLARQEARGYRVLGIGGETHVEAALVDEFKIGQATRKGWRVLVAGEHDPGDEVAVLLGEDFFDQVDVEFDLAHNAVRLFQPKDCDRVSLAYWASADVGEVEIDAVHDVSPQIILTVLINGQPVRAQLDSGAGASLLDKADAARLGVTPETPGVVAVGSGASGLGQKSVDFWLGPFQSFVIGDEIIRDTTILFGDLWKNTTYARGGSRVQQKVEGTPAMLLGADFLRAHRLLVAHSQRKIYFSYAGGPVFQRTAAPGASNAPKAAGASCQYSSECSGELGCINAQCQRYGSTADQCRGHTECSRDEWCIGSPRRCQPRFTEGMACNKDADCEGMLKCLSDRCARPN